MRADADRVEGAGQDSVIEDPYASLAEHKDSTVAGSAAETVPDEPDRARISYWSMLAAMVVVALFISAAIALFNKQPELSDEVRGRLVEAENMKQEMERLQSEREAALEKARLEEQQRALAEQAAVEAANKEKAARAAAELAAEEALQATKKAEEIEKKQRLEEQKLRDERKRIEQKKQQAELEWQRLVMERKQAKQEKERLELERTKAQELAQ